EDRDGDGRGSHQSEQNPEPAEETVPRAVTDAVADSATVFLPALCLQGRLGGVVVVAEEREDQREDGRTERGPVQRVDRLRIEARSRRSVSSRRGAGWWGRRIGSHRAPASRGTQARAPLDDNCALTLSAAMKQLCRGTRYAYPGPVCRYLCTCRSGPGLRRRRRRAVTLLRRRRVAGRRALRRRWRVARRRTLDGRCV